MLLYPSFSGAADATAYLAILVSLDIAIFALFGHYLVRRRVVAPLERVVVEVEAISVGDYLRRVPLEGQEAQEVRRLAEAVNALAERLINHQWELVANVRSLEETNRQLTEARDELIRMEKMASVGRLGAGIAHEIGNPLGAILGYLGVLGRGADGQRLELIRSAESEAKRIDRIVHGLLDYARPREARARAFDVNEVVAGTMELLDTQGKFNGVQVERRLTAGLPRVVGDANQLQQVLVNLMINACDALHGRPEQRLTVGTEVVRYQPPPRPPARRKDDLPNLDYSHRRRFNQSPTIPREDIFPSETEVVQISVADSGSGVEAEHLAHIFEPFYTTKEPGRGTGLGLAVAARLIDGMGGTIRVESQVDSGTVFSILLPREDHSPTDEQSG